MANTVTQSITSLYVSPYCVGSLHEPLTTSYVFGHLRTTIYTQYSVLVKAINDTGFSGFSSHFTYHHYLSAWYSFLKLLDVDFTTGFICDECATEPDTIIMDATSLAFRKDFLVWKPQAIKPPCVKEQRSLASHRYDEYRYHLIPTYNYFGLITSFHADFPNVFTFLTRQQDPSCLSIAIKGLLRLNCMNLEID